MSNSCPYVNFQFYSRGSKVDLAQDLIVSATWGRKLNGVGTAIVVIPSDCSGLDFDAVSQEDLGLLINVAYAPGEAAINDGETQFFLRRFKEKIVDKKATFELVFKDANHLLDRRIVAYPADDPEGTSPNVVINEPGNVALKRIFDTNFLADVDDPLRDVSQWMTSSGITNPSPIIEKEIQWKNVLRTMQQICRTSRDKGTPLFFDLTARATATDVRFQFNTYVNQRGNDRTPDIIETSHPMFQLVRFEIDYNTPNVGYVAGIGRGQQRQVAVAINARSQYGRFTRFEDFKSVRSGIFQVLEDEAENLVNDAAGIVTLEGQLLGTLSNSFQFGDRVLVHHRGFEVECEISKITNDLSGQVFNRVVSVTSIGTG